MLKYSEREYYNYLPNFFGRFGACQNEAVVQHCKWELCCYTSDILTSLECAFSFIRNEFS